MKLSKYINVVQDSKYISGFGVDAKWVGNALDTMISEMEDKKIKVLPELLELKQYLRFKGNSQRENDILRHTKVCGFQR